jgi:hypothetical protein
MAIVAVVRVPSVYLSDEATESQKQFYQSMKETAAKIQAGSHVAVILPSECDPDTRKPLYDIEIKGV